MNWDTIIGAVLTIPGLAVLASGIVGAAIPYLVEANVPLEDWQGWRFRLITYGVAVCAGLIAGITIWHSWSALSMWVPALGVQVARDALSQTHRFSWLSPRKQTIIRRDADGNITGIKEGDDPTILVPSIQTDPTQPKDQ